MAPSPRFPELDSHEYTLPPIPTPRKRRSQRRCRYGFFIDGFEPQYWWWDIAACQQSGTLRPSYKQKHKKKSLETGLGGLSGCKRAPCLWVDLSTVTVMKGKSRSTEVHGSGLPIHFLPHSGRGLMMKGTPTVATFMAQSS